MACMSIMSSHEKILVARRPANRPRCEDLIPDGSDAEAQRVAATIKLILPKQRPRASVIRTDQEFGATRDRVEDVPDSEDPVPNCGHAECLGDPGRRREPILP